MACLALVIAAALFGVGCGSGDERSALLVDVSQLEPGKGDEPSPLYIGPTADFSAYDAGARATVEEDRAATYARTLLRFVRASAPRPFGIAGELH